MTSRLSTLTIAAALAFSLVAQPATSNPPDCGTDCTTVVYIARYGEYLPVQVEYLHLIPCLNSGACVLFEDASIGPRPNR